MPYPIDIPATAEWNFRIKKPLQEVYDGSLALNRTQSIASFDDETCNAHKIMRLQYLVPTTNNTWGNINVGNNWEISALSAWNESTDENNLSSQYVNNIAFLRSSFNRALNRIREIIPFSSLDMDNTFNTLSRSISTLPFENAAVEINSNNSIKITLQFNHDKILMLTKSLESDDSKNNQDVIFYSFFINRQLISSDETRTKSFIQGFKEYISL